MNRPTILTVLAFCSTLLAGCGAEKGEQAAPADTPAAASSEEMAPADQADPAISDTLPTAEDPPPPEPSPPPG